MFITFKLLNYTFDFFLHNSQMLYMFFNYKFHYNSVLLARQSYNVMVFSANVLNILLIFI